MTQSRGTQKKAVAVDGGASRRTIRRLCIRGGRILFWVSLAGFAVWQLNVSWMRWMEVLIDFGREVYVPWRISLGEHLGTDIVHPYGPFSAYFNGGLFSLFGVSVRTLAIANLAILSVAVVVLFKLLKAAFGFRPAALALAFVVPIFCLGHLTNIGNYSFVMPYSHEATHGMLLLLLWIWGVLHAQTSTGTGRFFALGVILGLLCLTKTEYVATVALVIAVVLLRAWRDKAYRQVVLKAVPGHVGGAALVFLTAWLCLTLATGPGNATRTTFNAVLAPFSFSSYTKSAHVLHFLGTDDIAGNLRKIFEWGGAALAWLLLATVAIRASRLVRYKAVKLAIVLAIVAATFFWLRNATPARCGNILPGLLTFGFAVLAWENVRRGSYAGMGRREWARCILWFGAAGMMTRMALHPRIEHYGFFQALLAVAWTIGFGFAVWPGVALRAGFEQVSLRVLIATVCLVAAVSFNQVSLRNFRLKTTPVGENADRVFAFHPQFYPRHTLWERAREYLVKNTPEGGSLLVLPEGISLNYFTRRKHPVGVMDMLPATLPLNRKDVVAQLRENPPDAVVMIRRDSTAELGFATYGATPESGKPLVDWVLQNYAVAQHAGGYPFDPVDPTSFGVWILLRKSQPLP